MRKWNTLCLLLLLLTVLTACGQAQGTEQETEQGTKENPGVAETETGAEAAADTITVSTVAELITVIAPDAHIILKSGDYNFSKLTEEEIESCGGYVNPDALSWGEFSVYNAPGLTLEAEKSGPVRLITEDGYADVMTLTLCDGATLKGLILGHEIEKGVCDADVLQIDTCEDVTVEECVLFGCGANGIWAENADRLTVTKTDIYECTTMTGCSSCGGRRRLWSGTRRSSKTGIPCWRATRRMSVSPSGTALSGTTPIWALPRTGPALSLKTASFPPPPPRSLRKRPMKD